MTESTYYIMLALTQPLHGYGVMQKVEEISGGTVHLGPGTLYGAFQALGKAGLIRMVKEDDRRKCYQLTDKGRRVLASQVDRLQTMTHVGTDIMSRLHDGSLQAR